MEYPSKNDFYLKFKATYTDEGTTSEYIIVTTSSNIYTATGIMPEKILGKRISQIVTETDNIYGLKEFYNTIIPGARRKLEYYSELNDKWYLINLISEEKDYFLLIYNDISIIKNETSIAQNKFINENKFLSMNPFTKKYYRDNLTNLYTRDFFYEELDRLDAIWMLHLRVIMTDVNSLKWINDALGHDMGDKVLKRVASIMKDSFRKHEIISRIGGDEFAAILPMTSEDTAVEIVERVKVELEKNPLDYIVLSVSFGVATKVYKDESILEILQKADKRMYYMKVKENKNVKEYMINYLKEKMFEVSCESRGQYNELINLSMMMAETLNLDDKCKEELKLLCEYHDIGKVGISKEILEKPTGLNSDEWEDIKRHSEIGYHIIKGTKKDLAVNDLILIHHERWDGKGYPGFLKGQDIPIVVRIFSIVDAYVAMVNDRPYRDKLSEEGALGELRKNAGTQFDPKLVDIFIDVINTKIAWFKIKK